MERKQFIYLSGILPVAVCSVLVFLLLLTGFSLLVWIGLLMAGLGMLVSAFGCYHAYLYYNDKKIPTREQKARRQNFLGHTVALSLGLVFSYQSFQMFRQSSDSASAGGGLTIIVKNTSDRPAKDLKIKAGFFNQHIKELPARGEQTFNLNLMQETTLSTELGSGKDIPKASIQIAPTDRNVLIRLDYNQNILPEVN